MSATLEVKLSDEQMDDLANRIAKRIGGSRTTKKPLTVAELADRLGVSKATVYRRLEAGTIRKVPDIGVPRIPIAEVERLLAETSTS